jgi:multidrug efflux pump subunit AcrA (membrane-fusion protein)
VRIPASAPYEALLVPDGAIGTEQTRKYVLVVGSDDKAMQRYVTLRQATADNFRVIKEGIGPNDRVVINGLMRARPGQKVAPQAPGAAPPGAPQAAK